MPSQHLNGDTMTRTYKLAKDQRHIFELSDRNRVKAVGITSGLQTTVGFLKRLEGLNLRSLYRVAKQPVIV